MSQQSCLPVSRRRKRKDNETDDDIQFDAIHQMDGATYLGLVAQEASRLPEIFESPPFNDTSTSNRHSRQRVDDDTAVITGSAASAQYLVSHRTLLQPPPTSHHVPSRIWVDGILADFSRLRDYLDECRDHGVGGKLQSNRKPVPPMKDRTGWHAFCVGTDDASGNPGGYFQDDSADEGDEPQNINQREKVVWKQNLPAAGYSPTVSLLLQLDQVMVRRVLAHLTHYVTDEKFSVEGQRATWIYSLLARLDRPIHRDDAVVLYSLLKQLTVVRALIKLPGDAMDAEQITDSVERLSISTINVLIAIVGIYFEQGGGYDSVFGLVNKSSSNA